VKCVDKKINHRSYLSTITAVDPYLTVLKLTSPKEFEVHWNAHDSNHFTDFLSGKESAVYADSAYKSQKHYDWLKSPR
jgi:hypothetical protein